MKSEATTEGQANMVGRASASSQVPASGRPSASGQPAAPNQTPPPTWYSKQLDAAQRGDDGVLEEAMAQLAQAITGASDTGEEVLSAIDQIGAFFGCPMSDGLQAPAATGDGLAWLDAQLERSFAGKGVQYRLVELDGPWWRDAAGPMLAVDETGTPVALLPRAHGYTYTDPQTAKRKRVKTAADAQRFGTQAFCFYRPLPACPLALRDIAAYMLACLDGRDIASVLAALIVSTALGMLFPLANAMLFGPVLASGTPSILVNACVLLIGVGIAQALIDAAKKLVLAGTGAKIALQVQAAAMMRVLSLPTPFFRNHAAGELVELLGGFSAVANLISRVVLGAVLTAAFSLAYLGQIFAVTPALGVPAAFVIVANLLVSVVAALMQVKVNRRLIALKARLAGWQSALMGAMRAIRVAGAEKRAYATWAQRYADVARLTYNGPLPVRLAGAAQLAVSLLGTVAIYCASVGAGVSVSEYMAFSSAFGMVLGAFMSLARTVEDAAQIKPRLDTLAPLLAATPETSTGGIALRNPTGSIELSDVTFGYGPARPILQGLSLKIEPGDYVAIVGASGCGKSTVMRLLLGFEKPQEGTVCYDGHDMATLDVQALRRSIGVVLQDTQLFKGDILSNITVCAPWLSEEDAWAAAEAAGIADDLRALPLGLATTVAEGAAWFSGGQKQRLAIARALAPRPKILMFDEATSALDNRTQQIVANTLDALDCTRIVIAHRLSTIRTCRRICMLQGGRIVEEGTYDELMEQKGAFYELVRRQEL